MSGGKIANVDTPDPWMVRANGVFYLTCTLGNRIEVWESPLMEDFQAPRKTVAWHPDKGSPWSTDIWAPELHRVAGVWYIYAAATQPGFGNRSHRTIVLRSSAQDPMDAGAWEFRGPVRGMPDQFSIDATIFRPPGAARDLYICWSGWPPGDYSGKTQDLYISQMVSPEAIVDAAVMPPVRISHADHPWERFDGGKRGINEGPTWLDLPGGAFTGIVFSGHASFTSEYKLGLLRLVHPDADPLDPKSWDKRHVPLLMNERSMPGPYAPGHASFIMPSPDSREDQGTVFCIYHATDNWGEGFHNRKARIMAMSHAAFAPGANPLCCSSDPDFPYWRGGAPSGPGDDTHPVRASIEERMSEYALKGPAKEPGLLQIIINTIRTLLCGTKKE
jgi:GH43 family beta-xylosidase